MVKCMGEIRIKRDNSDWDNRPAHQFINGQWVDIPTHHYTNGSWQGELTSQSPLKFWADGEMLDWRVEGKTSGNLYAIELGDDRWRTMANSQIISRTDGVLQIEMTSETNSGVYALSTSAIKQLSDIRDTVSYSFDIRADTDISVLVGYEVQEARAILQVSDEWVTVKFENILFTQSYSFTIANRSSGGTVYVRNFMFNEGETALPYEPYGGVGDKTANLFGTNRSGTISTVSAVCNGSEIAVQSDGTNILVSATAPVWKNNFSINLSAGNYGYKIERTGTTTGIISSLYDANNALVASSQVSGTFTLSEDKSIYIGFFIPANTTANGTIKLTIVEGSTAPKSYIPYGYKIPVAVNGVTTNLYTDHQLMDGDSIDFATDQTAIPIATGNNTLTVDTTVQPDKVFVKFEG